VASLIPQCADGDTARLPVEAGALLPGRAPSAFCLPILNGGHARLRLRAPTYLTNRTGVVAKLQFNP
jgi:hypothetical protein